jgi:hypothetical protein
VTAVQCSYAELSDASDREAQLVDRFESLSEDEAVDLLARRYRRYVLLGLDWKRALLLAVDLETAA